MLRCVIDQKNACFTEPKNWLMRKECKHQRFCTFSVNLLLLKYAYKKGLAFDHLKPLVLPYKATKLRNEQRHTVWSYEWFALVSRSKSHNPVSSTLCSLLTKFILNWLNYYTSRHQNSYHLIRINSRINLVAPHTLEELNPLSSEINSFIQLMIKSDQTFKTTRIKKILTFQFQVFNQKQLLIKFLILKFRFFQLSVQLGYIVFLRKDSWSTMNLPCLSSGKFLNFSST